MTQYAGKGTLVKKGDGASPEVFTAVAQVRNIGGPGTKLDSLDVTHHGSTGGAREFIGGLIDSGEVPCEALLDADDASQDAVAGLFYELSQRSKKNWQILFPDGSTATFAALVTDYNPDNPVDGESTLSFTLKISGQITWANPA